MADDDTFVVGAPLPRIRTVSAHDRLRVTLTWESDAPGQRTQTIDLAPAVYRFKIYAPLRESPDLFRTVHVVDDGFAVAWDSEDLDMASTTIAELAEQAMTSVDFAAFIKRNSYTLDSVAAELGISRRLAAYYAKEREIPRTVALACRYLDKGAEAPAASTADVRSHHFVGRNEIVAGTAYQAAAALILSSAPSLAGISVPTGLSAASLMAAAGALRASSLDSDASSPLVLFGIGQPESDARKIVGNALKAIKDASRLVGDVDEVVGVGRRAVARSARVTVEPNPDDHKA